MVFPVMKSYSLMQICYVMYTALSFPPHEPGLHNYFKHYQDPYNNKRSGLLVEALRRRHGSLDGQASNVLPALLQQRDEVVDGQHDVTNQLILGHTDVSDGDTQAENFLQLELDCRLDIRQFTREILIMRNWGWEFASCNTG